MRVLGAMLIGSALAFGFAAIGVAAEPAPLVLANQQVYGERLRLVLAKEPAAGDPQLADWLREASLAASLARDFALGEGFDRALVRLQPDNPDNLIGLACSLDKQRRHRDALAECDRAATFADVRRTNLDQVRAIILYEDGQHEQAAAVMARIVVPAADSDDWGPYQLNRAVYAAYAGDTPAIQDAFQLLQALPGDHGWWLDYLRRDIDFDAYRGAAWFIAVAGPTLAGKP